MRSLYLETRLFPPFEEGERLIMFSRRRCYVFQAHEIIDPDFQRLELLEATESGPDEPLFRAPGGDCDSTSSELLPDPEAQDPSP